MFFFSPTYELLLLVSLRFSANGEEDGSSAECREWFSLTSSAGRSFFSNAGHLPQEVKVHWFSIGIWETGGIFSLTKEKLFS